MSRVVSVKVAPGYERDGLAVFQLAGANLWTGKIHQHRQRPIQSCSRCPRAFDVCSFFLMRAVRHVDPHAIGACLSRASITSGSRVAGPSVARIFAFLLFKAFPLS